jgi:hypothetical protein
MSPGARLSLPLALLALGSMAPPAAAHPATSVVMDAKGNVYYSDLARVWRVSPAGGKQVVVPGVHTHELSLDAAGNLYGEHLWYEGEKTDRWGHYVWRLLPTGRLERVYPARQGFRTDWSFVRDAAGSMYWAAAAGAGHAEIRRKDARGSITSVARGPWGEALWMAAAADGTLFFTSFDGRRHDLYRVSPAGAVRRLARDLAPHKLVDLVFSARHATFGLWPDRRGGAYVAVPAGRVVKHVTAAGKVTVAARSRPPWSPTGGMLAADRALWILEGGLPDAARLRRIAPDGGERVFE